ncbi:glutaredoxin family protein [Aliarcobacter butzleri]|nr:glutaredoxin family protein [Aliarcobacter butzleri]
MKSKNLKYNLIDLSKNKQALKDCQKHCSGAPVLLIGNSWICGFDKNKINKELGIK